MLEESSFNSTSGDGIVADNEDPWSGSFEAWKPQKYAGNYVRCYATSTMESALDKEKDFNLR